MSRPARLIAILSAGLLIAAGLVYWRSRALVVKPPGGGDPAQSASLVAGGPTPLPDFFESPGLVSRKDGPVRMYLTIAPDIALSKRASGAPLAPDQVLTNVPILVVLENDTYQTLDAANDLQLTGGDLFTLAITGAGTDPEAVFSYSEAQAELSGWRPAERKTFTVLWPTTTTAPGTYLISVRPAFGKQETLQIHTTLN